MSLPAPPTGLIDFFLHPPVKLLNPWLDGYGPYTGNVTLTKFSSTLPPVYTDHPVMDSYGLMLLPNGAIPLNLGFRQGWVSADGQYEESIFDEPLGQIVVQHQFLSGAYATTQREWIQTFPFFLWWNNALPARIGLLTMPSVAFDFFYLRTGTP